MNTILIRVVLIIVVFVQLIFLLLPDFGPKKYRAEEFIAASIARKERPSAETERAWQQELSLRRRHGRLSALGILCVFVVVNGLLCCTFWNYGKHQNAA